MTYLYRWAKAAAVATAWRDAIRGEKFVCTLRIGKDAQETCLSTEVFAAEHRYGKEVTACDLQREVPAWSLVAGERRGTGPR